MFDQSNMGTLFRVLSIEEEEDFRQYARDNEPPYLSSWEVYHPICRDEWMKQGINPKKV